MTVFSFFGTSLHGDGRIQSNIKKYLTENNIRYKYVIYPSQFHSTTVREVTALNYHDDFRCDGLITKEKGIVLVIVTADCVPIIYTDSNKGIIGISHQGWKGTLNKLPRQIIHEMELLGSSVANIQCEIGPHIGECCYHIYGERKNQFIHTFGESVISTHEEKTYLNLQKANSQTIQSCRILQKNIRFSEKCTSCEYEKYWSFHRDHTLIGEQFSLVVMQ